VALVRTKDRSSGRRESPPVPPSPVSRRDLVEEVLVVLSLSLLASAVFAIRDLFRERVAKTVVRATQTQAPLLIDQLLPVIFSLPVVWLVFHLVRRSGEGPRAIGLGWDRPARDAGQGLALAAAVGVAGLALYVAAVTFNLNRFIVPTPPLGQWWTYPVLVLNAVENALIEEVIVLGYLVTRLQQIGWAPAAAVAGSSALRGSYHLYQGFGGFVGNLAMGLFFGWLFLRWRRAWPMVWAHAALDVGAGVLYILFRGELERIVGL
jgi:membrane protease YdiL (CAAX protease family)